MDQGQRTEVQGGQLQDEPADQAGDAEQPDRPANQAEHEPGVEAHRLAALGPHALAHRGRGGAEACRHGQQDRRLHRPPPPAALRPVPSPRLMSCVSQSPHVITEAPARVVIHARTPLRTTVGRQRYGTVTAKRRATLRPAWPARRRRHILTDRSGCGEIGDESRSCLGEGHDPGRLLPKRSEPSAAARRAILAEDGHAPGLAPGPVLGHVPGGKEFAVGPQPRPAVTALCQTQPRCPFSVAVASMSGLSGGL